MKTVSVVAAIVAISCARLQAEDSPSSVAQAFSDVQRLWRVQLPDSQTSRIEIMNNPLKGSYFVAAGEDGLRSFSPDGKAWSHIATDREGVEWEMNKFDVQPYSTRQGKGRLVAIGDYGARLVRPTAESTTWEAVPAAGA